METPPIAETARSTGETLPAILRHAAVGVFTTDAAWRITDANPLFCRLLGLPAQTVLGRELAGLATEPGRAAAELGRLRAGEGSVVEWRLNRDDGTSVPARLSLAPLGSPGHPTAGLVGIVEDLTGRDAERRHLNDALRLKHVTERAARVGGWSMDIDRRSLAWTRGMRAIHEVPEDYAPEPLEALGFIVPESREAVNAAFIACARDGTPMDIEAEIETARGSRRWVRITGEAQRDAEGGTRIAAGAFQDITEAKATKEANRQLSERLSAMIGSITDAFFTLDDRLRFTYVNERTTVLLGRPASEMLGRSAEECPVFAPEGPFIRGFRDAIARGERVAFEAQTSPGGTWFEVCTYPAGSGLTVVLHDITARRAEGERLRLLEACVASLNDAILITEAEPVDEPGPRIVFVNDAFRRMTGYEPEEVLGRTPRMLQGPRTSRAELDRIRTALEARQPVRAEIINHTKSGAEFWVELNIVPVADADGRFTHLVAVQRDVTERKHAQIELEQHVALLDQVRDAIVVRDMAERVTYWNRGAERMYGWTPEEAIGRGVRDLVYADRSAIDGPMRELLASGHWSGRFTQRRRDGTPIFIDARWELMRHPDGTPRAVLAVSTDVTERLDLEERLRRAQRLEAVGQLTGGIAHDFNNLLTVILGNAEMLAESLAGDEELLGLAEMTAAAAERGAELTARLLAFSRRQSLDPKVVSVDALLARIEELVRRAAGERVELRLLPGDGVWKARIDPVQLEAAVLNLCINARDAMPEGGLLTIGTANAQLDHRDARAEREVSAGDYVMLTVADTGAGMAPEVAARVFEPFFTTKEVGQGSGLGLSMVYGFIKQSGGHVRIESEPGRGTRVRLYLPRAAG